MSGPLDLMTPRADQGNVLVRGGADVRPPPSLFTFKWDSTKAAAEDAYYDVPNRAADLRAGEIAAASTELARMLGKKPTAYQVYILGEPGDAGPPLTDEAAFWRDLQQLRKTRPDALKDLGRDKADYDARRVAALQQGAQDRSERMGKQGFVGNLVGGAAGSFTDPINILTLPIGGGGKTVATRIITNGLANAGVELAEQPLIGAERKAQGREFTTEERVTRVLGAGLGGAALQGLGEGVSAAAKAIPWEYKAARALRESVPAHDLTPEQAAALHVIERSEEVDASNPFRDTYDNLGAHAERVDQTVRDFSSPADQTPPRPRQRAAAKPAALAPANEFDMGRYLARSRVAESSGNDVAKAATSSAYGRYQFLKKTWLSSYKETYGDTGESVAQILAKRADGPTQDRVMKTFTAGNIAALRRAGLPVDEGTVYLAHFLGQRDALKVLRAAADAPLDGLVTKASRNGNKAVFGKISSASELISWARNKMGREGAPGVPAHPRFADDAEAEPPLIHPAEEIDEPDVFTRQLKRELFEDDLSWRLAQDAMDREALDLPQQQIVGEPPARGLAPANRGSDGRVYIGDVGTSHFAVTEKYPDARFEGDTGFVNPDGDYLTRQEALAWVRANGEDIKPSENMNDELDALDYREQTKVAAAAPPIVQGEQRGDFVEFSGKDADRIARALDITVTKGRDGRSATAIPLHAWERWRSDLADKGIRVGYEGAKALPSGIQGGDSGPSPTSPSGVDWSALRDEMQGEGRVSPVGDVAVDRFDDPRGAEIKALAEGTWHDILALDPNAKVDLGDGMGERSIADIRAELDADATDIDTIEACLK